jgi:large subunit ribosomal protein L3
MRIGILGRKIGMTHVFDEMGAAVGVTVIQVGPCQVTQVRTRERDGYQAVQLGFDAGKAANRPERGHLGDLPPYRVLAEFRVADTPDLEVGDEVRVDSFAAGDRVDVTATSKGKGFAGVVKRHGFRGGPRTHGQSDRLRAPGAIGAGTDPSRVFKGVRMAGRMGNARVTVRNLAVVEVDEERDLLLVGGAVPGVRNGLVRVRPATGSKTGGE